MRAITRRTISSTIWSVTMGAPIPDGERRKPCSADSSVAKASASDGKGTAWTAAIGGAVYAAAGGAACAGAGGAICTGGGGEICTGGGGATYAGGGATYAGAAGGGAGATAGTLTGT